MNLFPPSKLPRHRAAAALSGALLVVLAGGAAIEAAERDEAATVSSVPESASDAVTPSSSDSGILVPLIEATGVNALLASAADSFDSELGDGCDDSRAKRQRESFTSDALQVAFADALAERLDPQTRHAATTWYASDAGRRAAALEAASADLTEQQVSDRLTVLQEQPDWPDRLAAVKALLSAIRAAHFVTAFNVELDATLALAKDCVGTTATRDAVAQKLASERADSALVAVFIGIELLAPSVVIYAPLEKSQMKAYIDFARSAAGTSWHTALRDAMRDTFDARRDALSLER